MSHTQDCACFVCAVTKRLPWRGSRNEMAAELLARVERQDLLIEQMRNEAYDLATRLEASRRRNTGLCGEIAALQNALAQAQTLIAAVPVRNVPQGIAAHLGGVSNVESMAACLFAEFHGIHFKRGREALSGAIERVQLRWNSMAAAAIDHFDYLRWHSDAAPTAANDPAFLTLSR